MLIEETPIRDCFLIRSDRKNDHRGWFEKSYQRSIIEKYSSSFTVKEIYTTSSKKHVLRGMHFQKPPHDHKKIVFCLSGSVIDVFLDLRKISPTFGQYQSIEIGQASEFVGVILPPGIAHGFLSQEDNTLLSYHVSTEYKVDHDTGIHWKTFGFNWPTDNPIVSERDENFKCLKDYESPF